jgi:hypothetical protein
MLKSISIKSLYALALAEGEGVGTAYEYYAKRLTLARWLKQVGRPVRMLVAGLPQKYGSSLDFLLLAEELGVAVTVVDERPFALDKLQSSLEAARAAGWLTAVSPHTRFTQPIWPIWVNWTVPMICPYLPRCCSACPPPIAHAMWRDYGNWARPWPCSPPTKTTPPTPKSAVSTASP